MVLLQEMQGSDEVGSDRDSTGAKPCHLVSTMTLIAESFQ